MQSSKSVSSLMCGGGRFDLNPNVSLLLSSASWSFKKKKALQPMRWIRDSVFFITTCRQYFFFFKQIFIYKLPADSTFFFSNKSLFTNRKLIIYKLTWKAIYSDVA